MSDRDLLLSLYDIAHCFEKIIRYTKKKSFEAFSRDELLIDAVIKNLEIIGEATKNLPKSFTSNIRKLNGKR